MILIHVIRYVIHYSHYLSVVMEIKVKKKVKTGRGGGTPRSNYLRIFPKGKKLLLLQNDLHALKHEKNQ